jgi:hypothetical protein
VEATIKRVFFLMLLALSMLAAGALGGMAQGKSTKPALQITIPSSVAEGDNWSLQATGRSGKFNRIGVHAFLGNSCQSTESAMEQTDSAGIQISVAKDHKFNRSQAFVASNPGTHQACVYLYRSTSPGGGQLMRSMTYTVTP